MDQPLKMALHRPNMEGRVAEWALKLIEFDLAFQPQPSIKVQALSNFVTKYIILEEELAWDNLVEEGLENQCVLYMDGSSKVNGSRARLILTNPKEDII